MNHTRSILRRISTPSHPVSGPKTSTTATSPRELQSVIEAAWERRNEVTPATKGLVREAAESSLSLLDKGELRMAAKVNGDWAANMWLRKAVLLYYRLHDSKLIGTGDFARGFDKVPLKFASWGTAQFLAAGFRVMPGAVVKYGAHVGRDCVVMPSFINVGSHVGQGSMVDAWATVGSGAQVGRGVHLSGGVGIGGVLEPGQARPVVVEDGCFIGARSEIVEGCVVREGCVLGMGVFVGKSTKIIDRQSGRVYQGEIPAYSVVVPGSMPDRLNPGIQLQCAVIVKRVDKETREKTAVNELLRK